MKVECTTCNVRKKVKEKCRCKDCPFSYSGDIGTGRKFKKFGIQCGTVKHFLYYFIYHPELNGKLPKLPEVDSLGRNRKTKKRWCWLIHHKDENHNNDSKENLLLILNTEHMSIHIKKNNPAKNQKIKEKLSKITKNRMNNIEERKKISDSNKLRIKNGTHIFIKNNPNINTPKQIKIKNWISDFKNNSFIILTNEIAKKFKYSSSYEFRLSIKRIINRYNIKNIHFKKENNKWIMFKNETC